MTDTIKEECNICTVISVCIDCLFTIIDVTYKKNSRLPVRNKHRKSVKE